MEKTIELEIPLLLPDVKDEQDECLNRLEASLQNQKGILRAHLEREKSPVDLCLHYDPNQLTLSDVKRLAERAAFEHDLPSPVRLAVGSGCRLRVGQVRDGHLHADPLGIQGACRRVDG